MKTLAFIFLLFSLCGYNKIYGQSITGATLVINKHGIETKDPATIFTVSIQNERFPLVFSTQMTVAGIGAGITYTIPTVNTINLPIGGFITMTQLTSPHIEFLITSAPPVADLWNFDYYIQFDLSDGSSIRSKMATIRINTTNQTQYRIKLNLDNDEEAESNHKFMYLNAVNFDFTNSKTGYVGQLNMYSKPNIEEHWGFNAGISKINYTNKDSVTFYKTDNVKMKPLDELQPGSKYLKRYNEYKYKTDNRSFSLYFQPLFDTKIFKAKSKFYVHGHTELLISRFETTTSIKTIQQDTVVATDIIDGIVYPTLNRKTVKTQNILNGYFGIGFTLDLYLNKTSTLFLQPTIGTTTNYPQPASVNGTMPYYRVKQDSGWNEFYLIRAYYRNKLSTGTELIIGADIRGLFPQYEPFYAVYIGANLAIDKIVDLFK